MSEHFPAPQRETLVTSLATMCEYICEWADDATLFGLTAVLAQYGAQVAQRLEFQGPPCDGPETALAQHAALRTHAANAPTQY
jgi:hypothetical protein